MIEFNKPNLTSELSDDGKHGVIVMEPLERGYGITLGNSLRRVLLSSTPGCAVTSIKIDGVMHEFSTVPGVKEDVVEIVLNVKGIIAKMKVQEPKTVVIEVVGERDVTASDIKADDSIVILNQKHHIATVSEGFRFYMELTFEQGMGYVPQEQNKLTHNRGALGEIYVDSTFSPVYNVNYYVENTRVGSSTDFDKLTLDLYTNGVIDAKEAVAYASSVLKSHFELFKELSTEPPAVGLKPTEDERKIKIMAITLEEMQLSVRSFNCLKRAGINTIDDLTHKTVLEMMKIRNLGKKSYDEIEEVLKKMGLNFKDDDE